MSGWTALRLSKRRAIQVMANYSPVLTCRHKYCVSRTWRTPVIQVNFSGIFDEGHKNTPSLPFPDLKEGNAAIVAVDNV